MLLHDTSHSQTPSKQETIHVIFFLFFSSISPYNSTLIRKSFLFFSFNEIANYIAIKRKFSMSCKIFQDHNLEPEIFSFLFIGGKDRQKQNRNALFSNFTWMNALNKFCIVFVSKILKAREHHSFLKKLLSSLRNK